MNRTATDRSRVGILLFWSLAVASFPPVAASATTTRSGAASAAAAARDVAPGGSWIVESVVDDATGEKLELDLERFEVVAPGAAIEVHDSNGMRELPPTASRFFRGRIAGRPASQVFLALHEGGELRGVATDGSSIRLLGQATAAARAAGRLDARTVDLQAELGSKAGQREPFRCAGADYPTTTPGAAAVEETLLESVFAPQPEAYTRSAIYAVETDFEFYSLFGSVAAAYDYITDLLGFVSTIYEAETATSISVGRVVLRTTAGDPWTESGSSYCAWLEFGRYWNDQMTSVSRSSALMLSAKNTGGGISWQPALCVGPFDVNHGGFCPALVPQTDNYGGSYAYLGQATGTFDIGNPEVVWDLIGTAHEIGHNFNSPHSHCYRAVDLTDQVDRCSTTEKLDLGGDPDTCVGSGATAHWDNSGCACGTAGLPGVGTTTGGAEGQGTGTVMSYCYLLAPGESNVTFTLGTGHPNGVQAGRVPTRMSAYATAVGACLVPVIFLDGFESGSSGAWDPL